MNISAKDWDAYVKTLRLLSDTAANKLQAYINKYGIDDATAIAEYAHALITKYGEGSAELACQMYDAIGQAEGVILPSAVPAPIPTRDEVERAVLGSFAQSPTGKVTASIADRYVKLAAEDTMARNAIRDRAEWAWVPHGDTCAFCITLASRGWQIASKRILRGGHAEHVHAHCDCQFAIRHDGKSNVSGYDPDKYYQMYKNAEGKSPKEKIKSLRRELEDRDLINAQKRENYAKHKADDVKSYDRAKRIDTEIDLKKYSKSAIIDMKNYNEIYNYFSLKNISINGFDNKNLFDIKVVLAGVDDGISLMPESEAGITKIVYNPKLKSFGKMFSDGEMQIGPNGMKDYGTGLHETAHAFDFAVSGHGEKISEVIVETARKKAGFRKNSTEYSNMLIRMCGKIDDSKKMYEVFAYAVESELGGNGNKFTKAVVEELRRRNVSNLS